MDIKEIDKNLGKSFSLVQNKLDKMATKDEVVIDGITYVNDEKVKEIEKSKNIEVAKSIESASMMINKTQDLIKKIPTEYPKSKDYSSSLTSIVKKLSEVKSKIVNNDDVVKSIKELGSLIKEINKKPEVKKSDKVEELLNSIFKELKKPKGKNKKTQEVELTKKQLKLLMPYPTSSVDAKIVNEKDGRVNPAILENQDPTSRYQPSDLDEGGATDYYGFLDVDGKWYIMSKTTTAIRYTKGSKAYTTNWTNRASLTYDYFNNTF
jgi:hypothetical protein